MNELPAIAQFFEPNTIVNLTALDAYLNTLPTYPLAGKKQHAGKYALLLLSHVDSFEFAFKSYLAGQEKTLHWVCQEIRQFQRIDVYTANQMVTCSMENVRGVLLGNEWYELLPRYQQATRRIQHRFKLDKDTLIAEAKREINRFNMTR
ncbi:hypothetical protein [Spirosoma jeollabukense]